MGSKNKKTLIKEKFGLDTIKKVDEFAPTLITNWLEFLTSDDITIRFAATKSLSGFVFATKKQIESTLRPMGLEDFLREMREGKPSLCEGEGENELKRLGES